MGADESTPQTAYIITGPTSGIGYATALELAKHGEVILVGRDREKLSALQSTIESHGGSALALRCDISNITDVRRTAAEILRRKLPIAGLVNNAGIHQARPTESVQGWDMTFATDHLGPFAFTEFLMPHLAEGTSIVFIASGVEDPERKPAKQAGFRGGRYISAEASAHGEWQTGGSQMAGSDAYATSKQCTLAAALELARENPRLRINAVEPGFQFCDFAWPRGPCVCALPTEVHSSLARSGDEVLQHAETGREGHHEGGSERRQRHGCLLRRRG